MMLEGKDLLTKILTLLKSAKTWISDKDYTGYEPGISIAGYNTSSNYYVAPKDGIVRVQCWYTNGNWIDVHVANSDGGNAIEFQQCSTGVGHRMIAVPVFEGQRIWITQNGSNNNALFYGYLRGGVSLSSIFKAFRRFASLPKGGGVDDSEHKRTDKENNPNAADVSCRVCRHGKYGTWLYLSVANSEAISKNNDIPTGLGNTQFDNNVNKCGIYSTKPKNRQHSKLGNKYWRSYIIGQYFCNRDTDKSCIAPERGCVA